ERRDQAVARELVATPEVEGSDAEIAALRRIEAARSVGPRAEGRAEQVEAALLVSVHVREQRRNDRVAAVLARTREVQRRQPVVALVWRATIDEGPRDRGA